MSSVQSFLRQRVTGSTILPYTTGTSETYFSFVAGPGNYVGNYPPGTMQDSSSSIPLLPGFPSGGTGVVLRDMGKTIKASVSTAAGVSPALLGTPGFFRQVQIIVPSIVASPLSQTNNGVIGSLPGTLPTGNAGDGGYATFYIPIIVGGVVASNAAGNAALAIIAAGIRVGEQL